MNVVHAAKFYPPVHGGMERIVADLCEGTADRWRVTVVAANTGARTVRERRNGVDVVRAAAFGRAASVPLCPGLPLQLWRARADCVVLHEPNPIAASALLVRTRAPHLVIWHHSDLVRPWWASPTYGHVQRALYRRADCVIVSSPPLARDSALVGHARRVETIPYGVDLQRFDRLDAAARARVAALRLATPGPLVLFVGRLVYYKGVHVLVEAMARCRGTLVLVGSGPLDGELRALASSIGVAGRVRFLGSQEEAAVRDWYHACDLFVLPSIARTEAFGVVQIEAMAAGRPVISTRLPTGVPWVNEDGVSGLTVPPSDAEALAAAIERLAGDDDLRARLGAGASRRAHACFGRDRMIGAFADLVQAIAGAPGAVEGRPARAEGA